MEETSDRTVNTSACTYSLHASLFIRLIKLVLLHRTVTHKRSMEWNKKREEKKTAPINYLACGIFLCAANKTIFFVDLIHSIDMFSYTILILSICLHTPFFHSSLVTQTSYLPRCCYSIRITTKKIYSILFHTNQLALTTNCVMMLALSL